MFDESVVTAAAAGSEGPAAVPEYLTENLDLMLVIVDPDGVLAGVLAPIPETLHGELLRYLSADDDRAQGLVTECEDALFLTFGQKIFQVSREFLLQHSGMLWPALSLDDVSRNLSQRLPAESRYYLVVSS